MSSEMYSNPNQKKEIKEAWAVNARASLCDGGKQTGCLLDDDEFNAAVFSTPGLGIVAADRF